MKKSFIFLKTLIKQFNENELVYMSNELTYKMLLAIFPLLIYLINILTFFGVKYEIFQSPVFNALPDTVRILLNSFINSVTTFAESSNIKSLMNVTLLFTIYSSSSGFHSVIRGINKTYGVKDQRHFLIQRLLSVVLVIQFALTITLAGVFMVFDDVLYGLMNIFGIDFNTSLLINTVSYVVPVVVILINIILFYKVSSYKKISFMSTLPGASITVLTWMTTSFGYNYYINNFSKYNAVYGVIGSFIIFILWINIIAIVLLLGSQINALILENSKSNEKVTDYENNIWYTLYI